MMVFFAKLLFKHRFILHCFIAHTSVLHAVQPVVFRIKTTGYHTLLFVSTVYSIYQRSILKYIFLLFFSHHHPSPTLLLCSTPHSLFHDFWPVSMAYKSRFSFWEQKGSVFCDFWPPSLHVLSINLPKQFPLSIEKACVAFCQFDLLCCLSLCRLKLRTSQT